MAQRHYSSTAAAMQLQGSVNGSAATLTVDKVVGLPVSYPFTVVIDPGTESEEIVTVTNVAGTTLTVIRGEDGTAGVPHSGGAMIRHMVTARDLREPQQHIAATSDVHGVTGSLPGRLEALETLMGDVQVYKVADAAERDALVSQFPPSTSSPLFVWRVDANNGQELEYTKDGTTWYYVPTTEDADRIPNLDASKITSGAFHADRIPNLSASKIASGTLSADRIPGLNASKITAGTLGVDRVPNLPASKITSGTLNADRIPNLNASKITAGTLNINRIPAIPVSWVNNGTWNGIVDNGSGSNRVRIISGAVRTGSTALYQNTLEMGNVYYRGSGNDASIYASGDVNLAAGGGGGLVTIQSNGRIQTIGTYNSTTSSSPNVFITSTGRLSRSTSSRRYKDDIQDAPTFDRVLEIRPRTWVSKNSEDGAERHYGVVSEELADLGLDHLVTRNEDGQPEGVNYDRIGVALIPYVREQERRIAELEAVVQRQAEQIDGLHEVVEGLLARVEALEGIDPNLSKA